MKSRFLSLTLLAVAMLSIGARAAQQKPSTTPYQPPLLSDGQPDIQGLWGDVLENIASLNVERGDLLHETAQKLGVGEYPALKMFKGFLIDPPDGLLPHQPWALERRNEAMKEFLGPSPAMMDPQTRGWPNGIPRENYYSSNENGPFQILQPPGYVVFFYEIHHEFRIVPLDGRPHPGKDIKLWQGDSRGRWEGDTLVIDVTNNNDSTRFDVMGNFHSDEMRVTERWTIVDRNTLEYRATIDDPTVYTKPWTLGVTMVRGPEGNELMEHAGVEGDSGVATAAAIREAKASESK